MAQGKWKMLRLAAPETNAEQAEELLMALLGNFGGCGAHETEVEGKREWRLYFTEQEFPEDFLETLQNAAAAQQLGAFTLLGSEDVEQQNWHDGWRQYFQPVEISRRLKVFPSWYKATQPPAQDGTIEIFIEPGMAFGTGTHATTQLCLRMSEVQLRPAQRVLDIGTGSSILSIAALKMGAGFAVGFDKDPDITENVPDNLRLNDLEGDERLLVFVGTLDGLITAPFDLVLCNMLSQNFLPQLPRIPSFLKPGGRLVLSGFLITERQEVQHAVEQAGLKILENGEQAEWAALVAEKPE